MDMRTIKRKTMSRLVAISALLALISGSAHGDVMTFENGVGGYTGGQDTDIDSNNPDTISGGPRDYAYVSSLVKALYKFDLSDMAGLYTDITSIQLTLYYPWAGATPGTVNVHAISPANAAWTEAQACWNHLHELNSTDWAGSAGLSTPTTDYDPVALATWVHAAPGGVYHTFDLGPGSGTLKDLVDNWSVPATNGGLVLSDSGGGTTWPAHTGHGDNTTNPMLTVEFTPIPEPATLGVLLLGFLMMGIVRRRR